MVTEGAGVDGDARRESADVGGDELQAAHTVPSASAQEIEQRII